MKTPRAQRKQAKSTLELVRQPNPFVEVVRSYSFKLNCENHGGPKYEARDFFASQKAECRPEDVKATGDRLFAFCRAEVLESVRAEIASWRTPQPAPVAHPVARANAREFEKRQEGKA